MKVSDKEDFAWLQLHASLTTDLTDFADLTDLDPMCSLQTEDVKWLNDCIYRRTDDVLDGGKSTFATGNSGALAIRISEKLNLRLFLQNRRKITLLT